ncbi:Ff.00g043780.m01.CDS01 [Fusarium sp. VM40]|nr:Ff.00g043780.m01.CDS01 [Fusarium sp. VM40]
MSNQVPYPYNTELYVPIDKLSRTPSGRVYDPAGGPLRKRAKASGSSKSRKSRGESSRSQEAPTQEDQTVGQSPRQFHPRVNDNFIANVRRVLGEDYVSLWNSLEEMIAHMVDDFTTRGGRVHLGRAWTPEELEKSARLQVWQVPDEVVENILGWPHQRLTEEQKQLAQAYIRDEMARLM